MASKQRVKGFNYERTVVKILNDCSNTYAERMWGSNGKAQGLAEEVDISIDHLDDTFYAQCKCFKWANLPKGFTTFVTNILTNVHMGVVKVEGKDTKKSLVVMELETLIKLLDDGSNIR